MQEAAVQLQSFALTAPDYHKPFLQVGFRNPWWYQAILWMLTSNHTSCFLFGSLAYYRYFISSFKPAASSWGADWRALSWTQLKVTLLCLQLQKTSHIFTVGNRMFQNGKLHFPHFCSSFSRTVGQGRSKSRVSVQSYALRYAVLLHVEQAVSSVEQLYPWGVAVGWESVVIPWWHLTERKYETQRFNNRFLWTD